MGNELCRRYERGRAPAAPAPPLLPRLPPPSRPLSPRLRRVEAATEAAAAAGCGPWPHRRRCGQKLAWPLLPTRRRRTAARSLTADCLRQRWRRPPAAAMTTGTGATDGRRRRACLEVRRCSSACLWGGEPQRGRPRRERRRRRCLLAVACLPRIRGRARGVVRVGWSSAAASHVVYKSRVFPRTRLQYYAHSCCSALLDWTPARRLRGACISGGVARLALTASADAARPAAARLPICALLHRPPPSRLAWPVPPPPAQRRAAATAATAARHLARPVTARWSARQGGATQWLPRPHANEGTRGSARGRHPASSATRRAARRQQGADGGRARAPLNGTPLPSPPRRGAVRGSVPSPVCRARRRRHGPVWGDCGAAARGGRLPTVGARRPAQPPSRRPHGGRRARAPWGSTGGGGAGGLILICSSQGWRAPRQRGRALRFENSQQHHIEFEPEPIYGCHVCNVWDFHLVMVSPLPCCEPWLT